MKNIFITGVAGFIGSNFASHLIEKGYNVSGIDDLSQGFIENIPKEVNFLECSITEEEKYSKLFDQGIDSVFHFAALNSIFECEGNPDKAFYINNYGSEKIANLAFKNKVKRFIAAESSAIYEGAKKFPTNEDVISPKSVYAWTKLAQSYFMRGKFDKSDTSYFGLRYLNVYGPYQNLDRKVPPLFGSLISKRLNNESPIIYGDGSKKRDFIDVRDVNSFHLNILDEKVEPGIYNLGTGQNFTVLEILEKIDGFLGIEPLSNIDFRDDFAHEALENLADISKAKSTGWVPVISLDNGIKNQIEIMKNYLEK